MTTKSELEAAADTLNSTIAEIEASLASRFAVSAEFELSHALMLVWQGQLKIKQGNSSVPLQNAGLAIRLLAIEKLPELVKQLVSEQQRMTSIVNRANTMATKFLKDVREHYPIQWA